MIVGDKAFELVGWEDEACVGHAEGRADVLLEVVFKREPADGLDEASCPVEPLSILPARSRFKDQRAGHVVGGRVLGGVPEHVRIPHVVTEAGGMG